MSSCVSNEDKSVPVIQSCPMVAEVITKVYCITDAETDN